MINQELVEYLRTCGVCCVCQLRYLKARGSDYQHIKKTFQRFGVTYTEPIYEENTKKVRLNACPICLDLFSDEFQEQLLKQIVDAEITKFEIDKVVIALSLPMLLHVRQLSMWYALKRKFGSSIDDVQSPDIPLKEATKLTLNPLICHQLNKKNDLNGLMININLTHEEEVKDVYVLNQLYAEAFGRKGKRVEISRALLEKHFAPTMLKAEVYEKYLPIPPAVPNDCLKVESISIRGPTVYVAGRYRKICRELSHTPWILNGKRISEDSIEEIIIRNVLTYFSDTSETTFMSSGREDVDTRCLGNGRPFVLEIKNARRLVLPKDVAFQMERDIETSGRISVRNLQMVTKEELVHIKTGEEHKRKCYRALCALKKPVTMETLLKLQIEDSFVINQKTPLRVLHRRPLHTRQRTIYSVKTRVNRFVPSCLIIDVVSQAGTYIKELVHGEFGRTEPSLKSIIGEDIDIQALDVINIDLDWPPMVDNRS